MRCEEIILGQIHGENAPQVVRACLRPQQTKYFFWCTKSSQNFVAVIYNMPQIQNKEKKTEYTLSRVL